MQGDSWGVALRGARACRVAWSGRVEDGERWPHRRRGMALGHIQSDENLVFLIQGSSPCAEARLAHAKNPR
jgi:hypothetical protein